MHGSRQGSRLGVRYRLAADRGSGLPFSLTLVGIDDERPRSRGVPVRRLLLGRSRSPQCLAGRFGPPQRRRPRRTDARRDVSRRGRAPGSMRRLATATWRLRGPACMRMPAGVCPVTARLLAIIAAPTPSSTTFWQSSVRCRAGPSGKTHRRRRGHRSCRGRAARTGRARRQAPGHHRLPVDDDHGRQDHVGSRSLFRSIRAERILV